MGKIILGTIQIFLCPFLIILGYKIISLFNLPEGTLIFTSVIGGLGIFFTLITGGMLVIKGHQDRETFKGW